MVRQSLTEHFPMPIRNRNLGLVGSDSIPQRLDVVDLFLDGHVVESGRRERCSSTHRIERTMGTPPLPYGVNTINDTP